MNLTHFSPGYPPTLLTENLPPFSIQQEGNNVVLNYSLTIPERMFIAFIQRLIQTNLDLKRSLIFIKTTEQMQIEFNHWVGRTFTHQFSADALDVNNLVSSIWMKTKNHITDVLIKILQDQEAFENEKSWRYLANQVEKQAHFRGYSGKVFTVRQAKFLITAGHALGSSSARL